MLGTYRGLSHDRLIPELEIDPVDGWRVLGPRGVQTGGMRAEL